MADNEPGTAKRNRGPGKPFQKGQSGNPLGRPRGIDFRALIEQHRGATLAETLVKVFDTLAESAIERGDVGAAKLLFERLCETPKAMELAGALMLKVVTGVPDDGSEET